MKKAFESEPESELPPVFTVVYDGGDKSVRVHRRLTQDECRELRQDESVIGLFRWWNKSHYYRCHGSKGLARTIQDTTCLSCLQRRARQLEGWRADHPDNAEEVAYLRRMGVM